MSISANDIHFNNSESLHTLFIILLVNVIMITTISNDNTFSCLIATDHSEYSASDSSTIRGELSRLKTLQRTNSDLCGNKASYTVVVGGMGNDGIIIGTASCEETLPSDSHELLITQTSNNINKQQQQQHCGRLGETMSMGNSSFRVLNSALQQQQGGGGCSASPLINTTILGVPHNIENNTVHNTNLGSAAAATLRRSCLVSTPNLATICGVSGGLEITDPGALFTASATAVGGMGNPANVPIGRTHTVSHGNFMMYLNNKLQQ